MNKFFKALMAASLAVGSTALVGAQKTSQKPPASEQKQTETGKQEGSAPPAAQNAQAEIQALQAIQNELDPDKKIQLVNDFEKKYPNSSGIGFAYLQGAMASQQKGDVQRVVDYGERTLKVDANNPIALVLVATMLPEPQVLQGSELDREKKLSQAEEYANRAIKIVDQIPKQPNETDEQHQQTKGAVSGLAHSALGLVHLQRASMGLTGVDREELAKAEQDYKAAVTLSPRPDPRDYYRLGEAYTKDSKIDDAMAAFSKASELGEGTELKAMADAQVEKLKKSKSAAPPAKP